MNVDTVRCDMPSCQDLLPQVVRQAGYPSAGVVNPDILAEILRITERGMTLAHTGVLYRIDPLTGCGKDGLWGGGIRVRSRRWAGLARRLPEPRVLCSFVVTLGEALDRQIRREQAHSMFAAYLLDAVGSVLAEWLADRTETHVAGLLAGRGLQATGRFSPGYCDWEIGDGQQGIFRALKPETMGMVCTPSGMMVPRKSVSACMLGAPEVQHRYPCASCARDGCTYRREPAASASASGSGVRPSF
jgi:hypothetical protein